MKKLLLVLLLIAFTIRSSAQSLSYNQLNKIFNTWKEEKTASAKPVSAILRSINPKWKLKPDQPDNDSKIKSHVWFAADITTDTTTVVLIADQNAIPVKYSLRYTFYDKTLYNFILQTVKASPYYKKGKVTFQRNKGMNTLTAVPDENSSSDLINNFTLTDHGAGSGTFTADFRSNFTPK